MRNVQLIQMVFIEASISLIHFGSEKIIILCNYQPILHLFACKWFYRHNRIDCVVIRTLCVLSYTNVCGLDLKFCIITMVRDSDFVL